MKREYYGALSVQYTKENRKKRMRNRERVTSNIIFALN